MIKYKINVLKELKENGYTAYSLAHNGIIGNATISKIRHNNVNISIATLDTLCALLHCQISDIIEYIPDEFKGFDEFTNGVYNSNLEN